MREDSLGSGERFGGGVPPQKWIICLNMKVIRWPVVTLKGADLTSNRGVGPQNRGGRRLVATPPKSAYDM